MYMVLVLNFGVSKNIYLVYFRCCMNSGLLFISEYIEEIKFLLVFDEFHKFGLWEKLRYVFEAYVVSVGGASSLTTCRSRARIWGATDNVQPFA